MFFKTIIQGDLVFGNKKSYDKVLNMFKYRVENYHKSAILVHEDDIFFEEDYTLRLPRMVLQSSDKHFRNTVSILEYTSQFAVSGEIRAWQINEGKLLHYAYIEPKSDKGVVTQFQKGKKLAGEGGKEEEAYSALTKAIEKYDEHAFAYQKRGDVNMILQKEHDAMRDYNKCIAINESIPYAYYGRARINFKNKEYEKAIPDYDMTTKKAIALQSIYWKARRKKADCFIALERYEEAEYELKLLTKRKFAPDDQNYKWMKYCQYQYGHVLFHLGKYDEALTALEDAHALEETADSVEQGKILYYRGLAKQKTGKNGFIKDIKEAAEMGEKDAKKMLKELA